jgi:hypothetical protein
MHNGDTIQKLIAVVDTIHERASDSAVKTVFISTPQSGISNHDRTSHCEANQIRTHTERC